MKLYVHNYFKFQFQKFSKMSELIFMPTPNWFISRPIDINRLDGTTAVTAINSILITSDILNKYEYCLKDAHTKRLHSVCFYQNNSNNLLASCSEDLDVKVWNYKTRNLVGQHKHHQV